VVANAWAIHQQPDIYPDPQAFKPERFITSENTFQGVPGSERGHFGFGFGRRICPGLYIGERSIFIIFSRLLWAFNVDYARDAQGIDIPVDENAFTSGFSSHPKPFKCSITPRDAEVAKILAAHAQQTPAKKSSLGSNDTPNKSTFHVNFDKLVIAVGSYSQTFGVPGVKEYGTFLKDVYIRSRVLECFEQASQPTVSDVERIGLLHFAIVGGGPTGIELAAELHDLLKVDIPRAYPGLQKSARITVYEVKKVEAGRLFMKEEGEVPFGLLVWSTGLALNPLIRALEGVSKCKKALLTDGKLRVLDAEGKPMQDIWAIGDCAMAKDRSPLPATAQVANQKALLDLCNFLLFLVVDDDRRWSGRGAKRMTVTPERTEQGHMKGRVDHHRIGQIQTLLRKALSTNVPTVEHDEVAWGKRVRLFASYRLRIPFDSPCKPSSFRRAERFGRPMRDSAKSKDRRIPMVWDLSGPAVSVSAIWGDRAGPRNSEFLGTTASTRSAVGSHEEKAPHNGNGKDASGADILGARSADVDVEKVPITWKTYIVVFTCYLYQLQQIYFLLGSAFVVAYVPLALPVWWHTQVNSLPQASYVTKDIGSVALTNWIPIIPNLGQACLSPALAHASDQFGSRKWFILVPTMVSIIGAIVAGTSKSFGALCVGQALVGMSLTTVPLVYAVPSEILPRSQRAFAQAAVNSGATSGQIAGILISGGLLSGIGPHGWRCPIFVQKQAGPGLAEKLTLHPHAPLGFWLLLDGFSYVGDIIHKISESHSTNGRFCLYKYIERYASVEPHLYMQADNPAPRPKPAPSTFRQKLHLLDAVGSLLFTAGLVLILVGLSEGNNPAPWNSSTPIGLLVGGFATLGIFGAWEWYRRDGILSAELFRERNFVISLLLIFLEGVIFFAYNVFYPQEQIDVWESRPIFVSLRTIPFPVVSTLGQIPLGYLCTKYRAIRLPLFLGFVVYIAGFIGLGVTKSTTGPAIVAASATAGLGFVPIIVLGVVIAQLSTPAHLIGTATSIAAATRAVGASVGTAIFGSILRSRIANFVPARVPPALLAAGLPPTSIGPFLGALGAGHIAALSRVPGATPHIIETGVAAFKSALAKSFSYIWWSTIPFAAVGAILTLTLTDQSSKMVGIIDAPFESSSVPEEGHHY
ncbi:MAG: hypothetical protein CYPHOPRED_004210, partial [Cyphobasidiales sp. Tagirdzhanova-0007]